MPTYEYRCTECGQNLEVVQSFHDDPLTECPTCQGKLRKVFSPIGIAFKGSGFYKTDNRSSAGATAGNGGQKASGSGDSSSGDSSSSTSSSSSDSSSSGTSGTSDKSTAATS